MIQHGNGMETLKRDVKFLRIINLAYQSHIGLIEYQNKNSVNYVQKQKLINQDDIIQNQYYLISPATRLSP